MVVQTFILHEYLNVLHSSVSCIVSHTDKNMTSSEVLQEAIGQHCLVITFIEHSTAAVIVVLAVLRVGCCCGLLMLCFLLLLQGVLLEKRWKKRSLSRRKRKEKAAHCHHPHRRCWQAQQPPLRRPKTRNYCGDDDDGRCVWVCGKSSSSSGNRGRMRGNQQRVTLTEAQGKSHPCCAAKFWNLFLLVCVRICVEWKIVECRYYRGPFRYRSHKWANSQSLRSSNTATAA